MTNFNVNVVYSFFAYNLPNSICTNILLAINTYNQIKLLVLLLEFERNDVKNNCTNKVTNRTLSSIQTRGGCYT